MRMREKRRTAGWTALTVIFFLAMTVTAYAKTGWVYNGSAWNYYSADGTLAENQWLKDGDSLFWIQGDGTMLVNEWHQDGKIWYWFDASGCAVTGWQQINGKWYYFFEDHTMATSQYINSYYVGKDGAWIQK